MASILGMGNALVDIMTRLDSDDILDTFLLPKGSMQLVDDAFSRRVEGETAGLERILTSGGSAANTIHGLANLGIRAGYIGMVGNDQFAELFEEDLIENNIEPRLLRGKSSTGRAMALISPDSERTFATYLGAAIEMDHLDLEPHHLDGYRHFYIEGYLVQNRKLMQKALQLAKEKDMTISLDLASYNVAAENREFLLDMIGKYVDILFANEDEALAVTGMQPGEAISHLGAISRIVVVKLGEQGSMAMNGGSIFMISPVASNAIDTTGAGDLYASGFLYGLIRGYDITRCGEIASKVAGRITEIIGPKFDKKTWEDLRFAIGAHDDR